MNAKRLLKLAERLKTVKPEHFDMGLWALQGFEKHACGTTACAAGWACTIPSFKRAGLKLYFWEDNSGGIPVYADGAANHDGMEALERFFDLGWKEAAHLFGPDAQRTPKQEARIIERFVKTGKVPKVKPMTPTTPMVVC